MPNAFIAITMDDGSVALMEFITKGVSPTLPYGAALSVEEPGVWERPATDANIFAEITKAMPPVDRAGLPKPQPVRYKIVAEADIPADRTYRNAWRHDDAAGFHHDLAAAKAIHKDKVRRFRTAALGELDKEWMRAVAKKDQAEADRIEAERQALRDLPADPRIAAAATIAELKALLPGP